MSVAILFADLRTILADTALDDEGRRRAMEWSLATHRLAEIQSRLEEDGGLAVRSGPFEGMALLGRSCGSLYLPKLLGTYELELHPVWEALWQDSYDAIVNIGCADGYYAVGLARMFPGTPVFAYDIDAYAQETTRRLAENNSVADQVTVGGEFSLSAAEMSGRMLVVVDIEGAEYDVLDPASRPGYLDRSDLIVELHKDWLTGDFIERFAETHDAALIQTDASRTVPPCLQSLPQYDQFLSLCEFRGGPTPWLFLRARCV